MTKNISHWRTHARKVIQQVLAENKGKTEKEISKAISEAYPFGQRRYHPYKIWLDEVKVQTGKKKVHPYRQAGRKPTPPDPNQGTLEWVTNSDLSREVAQKV